MAIPLRAPAALVAGAALLAGLLTACVGDAGLPETCHDPSVSFEATLRDNSLEPDSFDACRGQAMTFAFTIEQDGVLHLHGYDDEVPATEVRAGQDVNFEFDAVRSGQFPIELHTDETPSGVTVGALTVHEP
jgi:hypothetical protein